MKDKTAGEKDDCVIYAKGGPDVWSVCSLSLLVVLLLLCSPLLPLNQAPDLSQADGAADQEKRQENLLVTHSKSERREKAAFLSFIRR